MKRLQLWRKEFIEHKYEILVSFLFLIIAVILDYISGTYVTKAGDAIATDIILDRIPSIDLSYLFFYGYAVVIGVLLLYPLFFHIKKFHIVISQFSLLILIRSFFITLTHLKTPADAIVVHSPYLSDILLFHNDLFFSDHTAVPFLAFLLFRRTKLGIFFLVSTIILALTVLFMHLHYSIDVFAAFFIAYGSYRLCNRFFNNIK